jgi:AraC-like DNA-binding protein
VLLIGRVPPPPLSAYINYLWYSEGWKPVSARQRHMPDGSMGVIIPLNDGIREQAIVSGPRSSAIFLDTSRPLNILGIQFKDGAGARFLSVPPEALTNEFVPLGDVARGGSSLREQLLEIPDANARLDRAQQWLMVRCLRNAAGPEPAVAWAVHELRRQPTLRVSVVADRIGRSSRWFADRFSRDIGLTPKVFSRLQRFQLALRRMHHGIDLVEVALASGYYDQAHFVHDFGTIAGMTPTAYLAGRTDHPNHVDLRD